MHSSKLRRFALLAAAIPAVAAADPYDFVVSRLGNPRPSGHGYDAAADSNFRVFARQLGAAITAASLSPPDTLGHAGFAISLEASAVSFSGDQQLERSAPAFDGTILLPALHVRKGLPHSLELGTRVAWIDKSRMAAATVELKWAFNEGLAYLPDMGLRGHVTRLLNSRDFDLTVGGVDIGLGKQFAVAGMMSLTPYVSWDLNFVGASTRVMDFRPTRSLAEGDSAAEQFKDLDVYQPVVATANAHSRLSGGFRLIAGPVMLGVEISYGIIPGFRDAKSGETRSVPSPLGVNGMLGVDF